MTIRVCKKVVSIDCKRIRIGNWKKNSLKLNFQINHFEKARMNFISQNADCLTPFAQRKITDLINTNENFGLQWGRNKKLISVDYFNIQNLAELVQSGHVEEFFFIPTRLRVPSLEESPR